MAISIPFDRQELIEMVLEYLADDIYYAIVDEDAMVYEALLNISNDLEDKGARNWQPYRERGAGTVFVKNVKGRGMPDWETVVVMVATQENLDYNEVSEQLSDDFLFDIWNEEAMFAIREQDIVPPDEVAIVAGGRSGGCWGVTKDAIDLDVKAQEVMAFVDMNLERYLEDRYTQEELDDMEEYHMDDVALDLADIMLGDMTDDELIDFVTLTPESMNKVLELDRFIEIGISDFEDARKWVDLIVMNEWHLS